MSVRNITHALLGAIGRASIRVFGPGRVARLTWRVWMRVGLAIVAISWLSAGCVATPSPEDPARCSVGSSVSHSRGQAAAWGETEETTVAVWGECGL